MLTLLNQFLPSPETSLAWALLSVGFFVIAAPCALAILVHQLCDMRAVRRLIRRWGRRPAVRITRQGRRLAREDRQARSVEASLHHYDVRHFAAPHKVVDLQAYRIGGAR
jgi:hypothetical protein